MFKTAALNSLAGVYINKDTSSGTPGTTVDANDRNIIQDEIVDLVESSGQALKTSPNMTLQVPKAVKAYSGGGGDFYVDSGSANLYVASSIGSFEDAAGYFDGMKVVFKPAYTNTGASTINVSGLGAKAITTAAGVALAGGEIQAVTYSIIRYNLANDRFEIEIATAGSGNQAGDLIELPYVPTSGQMLARRMLQRNGASLLRSAYPDLFDLIGVTYGAVDGSHFNLPDDRGLFIRGFNNGGTNDPDAATRTDRGDGTTGDAVGTLQDSQNKVHNHERSFYHAAESFTAGTLSGILFDNPPNIQVTANTGSSGGNQANPINRQYWVGIFY